MMLTQHKSLTQKSLYLAVMLALPAASAMAEEKAAEAAPQQTLEEVKVQAGAVKEVGGYQATKTRVGKVLQDPHDVPQAITSVTHDLMHDQQVSSLRDALRNVSGLTFNAAEGGRGGDNFNLRGFYTFGDIYLDNMRDTAQYYRETFNLDQVDVLRGSAAMLFGRGQAGGVINQVTKMAKLEDKNTVTGSLGSYSYHQMTGDFNKKLGDTTAIRLNVMDRHEENYRQNPATGDRPEIDRQGIAVSFGTGIGTDNEFYLNHVYTQTRDVPDFGISFYGGRPANRTVATGKIDDKTFYGGNQNFDNSDTRVTTGIFTHKFSEDTQLRTQLRSASYDRAYWAKTPHQTAANAVPTNASLVLGQNQARKSSYDTLNLQSDFSTKLNFAGMKHQVLAGVEYLKEDSYRQGLRNIGTASVPGYTESQVTGVASKFDADNYAVYAQDTIEFVKNWEWLVGLRRDEMKADYSGTRKSHLNYGENSYRTGLSWHQTPDSHYYLSYSDSFSPTADLYQIGASGAVEFPAERSKTVELGAKWLFLDGDFSFRTALYSTTKDWERNTDLEAQPSNAILTKKRRTNGLEFETAGHLTDNWEVFAGIALMDAKIIKAAINNDGTDAGTALDVADPRFEGQRARNTPTATFNLWTTYSFLGNWKVGGGVEAKGERQGYVPSQQAANTNASGGVFSSGSFRPNIVPGYARVDAMLAYEEKKWAVRLNVKNLLNKVYYGDVYDNGAFLTPGNSRTAILTTEIKF
nr:TonB-dependent receptor [uncultured Methylotenera sp.]